MLAGSYSIAAMYATITPLGSVWTSRASFEQIFTTEYFFMKDVEIKTDDVVFMVYDCAVNDIGIGFFCYCAGKV